MASLLWIGRVPIRRNFLQHPFACPYCCISIVLSFSPFLPPFPFFSLSFSLCLSLVHKQKLYFHLICVLFLFGSKHCLRFFPTSTTFVGCLRLILWHPDNILIFTAHIESEEKAVLYLSCSLYHRFFVPFCLQPAVVYRPSWRPISASIWHSWSYANIVWKLLICLSRFA